MAPPVEPRSAAIRVSASARNTPFGNCSRYASNSAGFALFWIDCQNTTSNPPESAATVPAVAGDWEPPRLRNASTCSASRYPVDRTPRADCQLRIAARRPRTEQTVRSPRVEARRPQAQLNLPPRGRAALSECGSRGGSPTSRSPPPSRTGRPDAHRSPAHPPESGPRPTAPCPRKRRQRATSTQVPSSSVCDSAPASRPIGFPAASFDQSLSFAHPSTSAGYHLSHQATVSVNRCWRRLFDALLSVLTKSR